ncbi:MAG TPA: PQQ-binding-like beta-propeller repeat protein [Candidatus Binatia bacterium]|nr:PQQ-binding-like beta-propeller repeat protein [Candidatus Binatia bacterium]
MRRRNLLWLLLALSACPPPLQNTWPKFHHDIWQTGLSQFSTAANAGAQKWRYATAGAIHSSPAIADDGTIYVGSVDGYLHAVRSDGTQKWRFPTGGAVWSSPAIANDGTVYVGSTDGNLYAVTPGGGVKWKHPAGSPIYSSPSLGIDGTIYVGSNNGYLHAVTSGGTALWKSWIYPGPSIVAAPVIGGDLSTVYVGAESPDFIAFDPTTGAQKWNFVHTGNPGTTSAAVVSDGTIYVGAQDGKLYALNPTNGSVKWSFSTGLNIAGSSPAVATDGTIYVGSLDHYLYAVTPGGTQKWRFQTGSQVSSSPALGSDGTIYFGSDDQYVYALNADGSLKWKFLTGDEVDSSPAIDADGTVYVGSKDHYLYALGPGTPPGTCCAPQRIVMQSVGTDNVFKVASLGPLPFPAGAWLTIDTGAADAGCRHDAIVPAGGFTVPAFCIPALGFTTTITAVGCDGGGSSGSGAVWDGGAPTADPNVTRVGDTSDPDGNACAALGTGCSTAAGGAGTDAKGNVNTTRGGSPVAGGQRHGRLDVPVHARVWGAADGSCPDPDGTYNSGTDLLASDFDFMMSLTTGATGAEFVDLNGDGCERAGGGPDHTQHCSGDATRPCTITTSCTSPTPDAGTCVDGPLNGIPGTGCCTVGQIATLVYSTVAFTGGAPIYDVLIGGRIRFAVTQCSPAPSLGACTLGTNPCTD